jgi:lipopolysaccharide export LptBFGC system permease protein LptF
MFTARSGRNEGLGISIIIMLVFYGLKVGTETLIQKQDISPVMEWFPNILFMTIGLVLLIIKVRE